MKLPEWIKELLLRIGGSTIGIGLIAFLAVFGNSGLPGSSFFDSKGGVFIGAIILSEIFFFVAIAYFFVLNE